MSGALRVGIAGCGLIGRKRAEALDAGELAACFDPDSAASDAVAGDHGGEVAGSLGEMLQDDLDAVVVATPHDRLAETAVAALDSGCHVLVEKPAGIGVADIERIARASGAAGRQVKVGFNHRFAPAISQLAEQALSGRFGDVMFARARYGHGGRVGYESEWRMDPGISGGGEMLDQGMHLIDLFGWLLGPLPLHSALLRTQFWDSPVEDNAVFTLAEPGRAGPWASAHVSWTEWKNLFSLEVYCRTGKLQVDGLAKSYGPQRLTIHAMSPEMGPPDTEVFEFPPEDVSWRREWEHFRETLETVDGGGFIGGLDDARYAWSIVEEAYARDER